MAHRGHARRSCTVGRVIGRLTGKPPVQVAADSLPRGRQVTPSPNHYALKVTTIISCGSVRGVSKVENALVHVQFVHGLPTWRKCNHVCGCAGLDLGLIDWLGARRSAPSVHSSFGRVLVRSTGVVLVCEWDVILLPHLSCLSLDYWHVSFSALPFSFSPLSLFVLLNISCSVLDRMHSTASLCCTVCCPAFPVVLLLLSWVLHVVDLGREIARRRKLLFSLSLQYSLLIVVGALSLLAVKSPKSA